MIGSRPAFTRPFAVAGACSAPRLSPPHHFPLSEIHLPIIQDINTLTLNTATSTITLIIANSCAVFPRSFAKRCSCFQQDAHSLCRSWSFFVALFQRFFFLFNTMRTLGAKKGGVGVCNLADYS
jgi:hypothetical protein